MTKRRDPKRSLKRLLAQTYKRMKPPASESSRYSEMELRIQRYMDRLVNGNEPIKDTGIDVKENT